jgi:hypothetical protein
MICDQEMIIQDEMIHTIGKLLHNTATCKATYKLPNLNTFPRQPSSALSSQALQTIIKWGKTNEDTPLQSTINRKEETLNMNHLSEVQISEFVCRNAYIKPASAREIWMNTYCRSLNTQ